MPEQRTNGGLSGSLPTVSENAAMGFRPKNIYIYLMLDTGL